MEIWILVLVTTLGPNKFLYDPYLETVGEQACRKQADFVRIRQPEVETFCVRKK
jgi:hypothetical protein